MKDMGLLKNRPAGAPIPPSAATYSDDQSTQEGSVSINTGIASKRPDDVADSSRGRPGTISRPVTGGKSLSTSAANSIGKSGSNGKAVSNAKPHSRAAPLPPRLKVPSFTPEMVTEIVSRVTEELKQNFKE